MGGENKKELKMINDDAKIVSYYVRPDGIHCWYVRNLARDQKWNFA